MATSTLISPPHPLPPLDVGRPVSATTIAVIGTGGSGGWFAQLTGKSNAEPGTKYVLIDGDLWATSNLVRQFCTKKDLGRPKVDTMASILSATGAVVEKHPCFLTYHAPVYTQLRELDGLLVLFVAVDNHPARRLCYLLADERHSELVPKETLVISVANEYETASAWTYLPAWANTPLDPRIRWPEIMTDDSGDPLRPPCTGEAAAASPQLALANLLSASAGAWLLRFWTVIAPKFKATTSPAIYQQLSGTFPVLVDFTEGRQRTHTVEDLRQAALAAELAGSTSK